MVLVKFHRAVRERKRGEERERDRSLYFLHHILLRVKYNLLGVRSCRKIGISSSPLERIYVDIFENIGKIFFTIKIFFYN